MNPQSADISAPKAKKIPKELSKHGHTRIDDYYWLNQREDPEVIAYLEAENAYTATQMQDTEALQEKLFEEIKGRIKQSDMSVPYRYNGYSYYVRFKEGQEYPIYCRARLLDKDGETGEEEVMIDVNQMAEGHNFYALSTARVSDDNRYLAFFVDKVGRRQYTLHIKDLQENKILEDQIPDVSGFAWSADPGVIFYGKKDPDTLRPISCRHT
ncbi:MAG: hypothetical protein AAFU64_01310 [Bacteroidota bacterium]